MASFADFNYKKAENTFSGGWQVAKTYTTSDTFVSSTDGWVLFVAIGAGGSGGVSLDETGGNCVSASGGGAGGLCVKKLFVRANSTYTITIGAGGASRNRTTTGTTAGAAGGDTTIVGPELYILAGGGGAGNAATVANNGTASNLNVTGGAGGIANGGEVNNTGMAGGSITITTGTASDDALSSGGGAVNLFNSIFTGNYSGTVAVLTVAGGGIGVGGNAAISTANNPAGGGSGMGFSLATPYNFFGLQVDGVVGSGNPGCGGIGETADNVGGTGVSITATAGNGGIFGGGGSATAVSAGTSGNATATAGNGGSYGGGGGSAAGHCTASGNVTSGTGGGGLVLVFWGVEQ